MNPSTAKALERALRSMERSRRPVRRFTLTPLITAIGCAITYVLLTYLLPRIWENTLPGGLDAAARLQGWPGLIWRIAVLAYMHFFAACILGGVTVFVSILLCRMGHFGRFLAWLLAVTIVLANAGILFVAMRVPVAIVMSS